MDPILHSKPDLRGLCKQPDKSKLQETKGGWFYRMMKRGEVLERLMALKRRRFQDQRLMERRRRYKQERNGQ